MKRAVIAALFVLTVATSAFAEPITVSFDPDGGGGTGSFTTTTFDWAVGNSILIADPTSPGSFTILYQANLGFVDVVASADDISNGEYGTYFTAVAGFGVTIDTVNSTATNTVFLYDSTSDVNFFNVYADTTGAGDNLAGTGFDDGTLILSGTAIADGFSSFFGITSTNAGNLDQYWDGTGAVDDYPGVDTIQGTGATNVTVVIDSWDPLYFLNLVEGLTVSFTNTSQIDPYQQADPSALFSLDGAGTSTCGVPCVGTINGLFINSDRAVAQSDANTSFAVVPEPASLMLFGLGILGVAAARRRHIRNQSQSQNQ